MSDMISRQAAFDALRDAENNVFNSYYKGLIKAHKIIADLPSAQPEQSNASEFWRKRADFYSDMCMNLIGEMKKGVKIESVKISENGIEFIKGQPSVQPEIIHCKDCEYFDQYSVECMNENGLKHIKSLDDYCKYAERRTDEDD